MKSPAIIVDLDGTLCNVGHRVHHLKKTPKDWKAWNAGISKDPVNKWCRDLIEAMNFSEVHVLILSAREEIFRPETEKWLAMNRIEYLKLFMRPAGDRTDDHLWKPEVYKTEIEPFYDIRFVLEDRTRVVEIWRELGLTCLQCDKGDF